MNTPKLAIAAAIALAASLFTSSTIGQDLDLFQFQRDNWSATDFARSTLERRTISIFLDQPETGETGLWKLELAADTFYDTNAFQNATELEDWHVDANAKLSYDWWPEESWVLSTFGSIGFQRFDEFSGLDGESLGAGAKLALKETPVPLALTYGSTWIYTKGFSDNSVTTQALDLSSPFWVNNPDDPTAGLTIGGRRNFVSPSTLDSYQFRLGGDHKLEISDKVSLKSAASILYRSYDDFAPGIDRSFWLASVGTTLSCEFTKDAEAHVGVTYFHNDDKLPVSDYDRFIVFAGLSLTFEKAMSLIGGGYQKESVKYDKK